MSERLMARMCFIVGMVIVSNAHAHLMPQGHGTLNVMNGKAYVVLALPVTALKGHTAHVAIADGALTPQELKQHGTTLRAVIRRGITLTTQTGTVPLSSILLNLPQGAHHTSDNSTEITAMIVAPLNRRAGTPIALHMTMSLWGAKNQKFKLKATVTQSGKTVHSEIVEFTPDKTQHLLFGETLQ